MLSSQGKEIKIISPGDWNRGAGPDFLGAEILINNERLRGDIEIHLRWSDWEAHDITKIQTSPVLSFTQFLFLE